MMSRTSTAARWGRWIHQRRRRDPSCAQCTERRGCRFETNRMFEFIPKSLFLGNLSVSILLNSDHFFFIGCFPAVHDLYLQSSEYDVLEFDLLNNVSVGILCSYIGRYARRTPPQREQVACVLHLACYLKFDGTNLLL